MSRLYDRLTDRHAIVRMPNEAYYGTVRQSILRLLPQAHCLNIDDVAAYYWQELAEDGFQVSRWRADRDFPNLAPPFDCFWMEFRIPSEMKRFLPQMVGRAGALIVANDVTEQDKINLLGHEVDPAAVRWLVQALSFNDLQNDTIVGPHLSLTIPVDKQGQYVSMDEGAKLFLGLFDDTTDPDAAIHVAKAILYPCLLAISFLHCQNVTIIDDALPPRADRRRLEREGRPVVTFKTLNINPMKEVLRREGQIEKTGLKKALHICRGHFAHYGDEYGTGRLFGKYEGAFWIPQTVKGNIRHGAVVKDYAVKV